MVTREKSKRMHNGRKMDVRLVWNGKKERKKEKERWEDLIEAMFNGVLRYYVYAYT